MEQKTKTRFFDDVVCKTIDAIKHRVQTQLRSAITQKYDGRINNKVFWIPTTRTQHEGLSEDRTERLVQRFTLSLTGFIMAHRMWAKRTFIALPLLFIVSLVLNYMLFNMSLDATSDYFATITAAVSLIIGLVLIFGTSLSAFFAQLFLPNYAISPDEIVGIESTIKRCVIRDIPENAPADFQDRARILAVDSQGEAVAGQVSAFDLEHCALSAEWIFTVAICVFTGFLFLFPVMTHYSTALTIAGYYVILMIASFVSTVQEAMQAQEQQQQQQQQEENEGAGIFKIALFWVIIPLALFVGLGRFSSVLNALPATGGGATEMLATVTAWIVSLGSWFYLFKLAFSTSSQLRVRAELLERAVIDNGSEFLIDKAGKSYFLQLEAAKNAQIENVINDKSAFVTLGYSTGILAQRRDPLAVSEPEIPMGLSFNDLSTHLFVLGASGTGKTTGVIRPVAQQWLNAEQGGFICLDGKGALPLEISGSNISNYLLISPKSGQKFNPISGMKPDSVADTIAAVFADNKGDAFWSDSATLLLRNACVLCDGALENYTLNDIYLCVCDSETQAAFIANVEALTTLNNQQLGALTYFKNELPAMPDKTRGSIENMVRTWLGNIVGHEVLGEWVNTETNETGIETIFQGARIGLLLPESEFGKGGAAISALVLRRVYDLAKNRGDKWREVEGQKPVMVCADEVQGLVTDADIENAAIARSLGLSLVYATQNIDGLYKRLQQDGTRQLLGNFASFVAFPPRTNDSNEYIAHRAGKIWKCSVDRFVGLPDAQADVNLYLDSGADKSLRSMGLYNQMYVGNPRNSFMMGQKVGTFQENGGATLEISLSPLVDADEIDTLLARPQTALLLLNRGRVQRRDVAILGMVKGV